MKRGRKAKPTNLRILEGGASLRRLNPDSPQPPAPSEMPEPPFYLNAEARLEWDRVIADLYSTGIYANIDETMLAAYCMAFSRWVRAEQDLEKIAKLDPATHGAMIKTSNGNAIQNPLVGVASTARRDMHRLATEFGMTPSSRATLSSGRGQEDDPIARRYAAI